jgi:hypothetical protein
VCEADATEQGSLIASAIQQLSHPSLRLHHSLLDLSTRMKGSPAERKPSKQSQYRNCQQGLPAMTCSAMSGEKAVGEQYCSLVCLQLSPSAVSPYESPVSDISRKG